MKRGDKDGESETFLQFLRVKSLPRKSPKTRDKHQGISTKEFPPSPLETCPNSIIHDVRIQFAPRILVLHTSYEKHVPRSLPRNRDCHRRGSWNSLATSSTSPFEPIPFIISPRNTGFPGVFREKSEERREGSGRWMKRKREKGFESLDSSSPFFLSFCFQVDARERRRKGGNVNFIPDNVVVVELSVVGSIIFARSAGRQRLATSTDAFNFVIPLPFAAQKANRFNRITRCRGSWMRNDKTRAFLDVCSEKESKHKYVSVMKG